MTSHPLFKQHPFDPGMVAVPGNRQQGRGISPDPGDNLSGGVFPAEMRDITGQQHQIRPPKDRGHLFNG